MTFMPCSKGSDLISRFYFLIAFIVTAIGVVIDLSHAAVIPQELDPAERSMVVDTFKRNILDHLGLEAPPTVRFTNKSLAHEAIRLQIKDFLRRLKETENQYDDHETEIHSHQDNSEEPFSLHFQPSDRSLKFPVAQDPTSTIDSTKYITFTAESLQLRRAPTKRLKFKSANLHLNIGQRRRRLRHETLKQQGLINVTVSLLLNFTPNGSKPEMLPHFLKSFIFSPTRSKDFQIDLSSYSTSLSDLSDTVGKSVTFEISVQELGGQIGRSSEIKPAIRKANSKSKLASLSLTSFLQIVPRLEGNIVMKDRRRLRKKRHASGDCRRHGYCRRQSIYISFEEIGWDSWVLSPEGYTAYYCSGGCPRSYKAASAFTSIKAMLHQRNPSRIPEPTCAPAGYRPIKLLHFDESQELVETNYPNMVVTGCRCF